MPKPRKQPVAEPAEPAIPLRHPDRSGPSHKTLLDIASQHDLFRQAAKRENELARQRGTAAAEDDDSDDSAVLSPRAQHILEAALWTGTIAMLHFTFDVLVQHQYGREIDWPSVVVRMGRAWGVFLFLFYSLHPFDPQTPLLPLLPPHLQHPLRQAVFFAASVLAGCHLIHTTNTSGHLAMMKKAPPLGCLWLWAVVELDLLVACASLVVVGVFMKMGGYDLF
ncbi:hypothetical protein E4U43_005295 [Claviceps pusilla]|uniref:DUF7719 domain-containing protein n=1 Tax=Claviceps pusilla TaxID=123648 RepID=A0A9P7N293_9HYPO|nr:hypothetical protein E4U43_005295 [Claviceps pusilla]